MKHLKKTISLLLCAILLLAMIPIASLSANAEDFITVYFTDAVGWGTANIYYWWEDGTPSPEWPGTAMTPAGTYSNGVQAYSATIPMGIHGIVFNDRNGNQTVDITENIVNEAHWYTTGERDGWNYIVDQLQSAAPTPQPPTPIQGESITVYFTDAVAWGAANIYYWWEDGSPCPEWPGTGMRPAGLDSNGKQIYSADIPKGIYGIVFNDRSGRQTVDITENIVNGAHWYTAENLPNYSLYAVEPKQANADVIAVQPSDWSGLYGEQVNVSAVSAHSDATYEWYYRPAGRTDWINTYDTDSCFNSFTMNASRDGGKLCCLIDGVWSDVVTLTMIATPPVIFIQPSDWSGGEGESVSTSVTATGKDLTYQWFYRPAGKTKWIATADTDNCYDSITMNASRDGRQVYCRITDAYGNSVDSDIATLSMTAAAEELAIITQPTDWEGGEGESVSTSVSATGKALTYQWFYRPAGKTKWIATADTDSCYDSITMNAARNGRQVYCRITDAYGNSVDSDIATLTMTAAAEELAIITQPTDWTGDDGETVNISVVASGSGLTYQWFYWKPEKKKWIAASDNDACYDSIQMNAVYDGRQVYCKITDANGNCVYSDTVTISYPDNGPVITVQTANWAGRDGEQVNVSVAAKGKGLTYQWYYWKTEKNKWVMASDTDSCYDSITMAAKYHGRMVYCKITDQNGNKVNSAIALISYPVED